MFKPRIPAILNPLFGRRTKSRQQKQNVQFTQAELQRMSFVLRNVIHSFNELRVELRNETSQYWEQSDKNNPETAEAFKMFSRANRERKTVVDFLRKLEQLQSKVKKAERA